MIAVFAALIAALFLKAAPLALPDVREANVAGQFDAERAIERLSRILGDERPHPVDSSSNDAVRARLLSEIEALGYAPEVRDDFSCLQRFARVSCARVRNIVFRAGPEGGGAVMIASHYDSVPAGPGAGDDGIGVATSLELAKLLADAPPQRPVLFLMTDGEEMGLLGAASFADNDPLADDVESVINLEARGVRGPALMFETSVPNERDVRAFAKGSQRPVSNSLMTDIYRLLPNDTDVSVLLPRGYDAVNMAISDGLAFYHTPRDDLAALDLKSVQHMGDQALGTLKAFLGADRGAKERQLIFADILSRAVVILPQWSGAAVLILSLFLSLSSFFRAKDPRPIRAALTPPLILISAGGVCFGLQWLVGALRTELLYWYAVPQAMQALAYFSAVFASVLVLTFIAAGAGRERLLHASWFWFSALGAALYSVAPGATILWALPLLFYALGAAAQLVAPQIMRPFAIAAVVVAAVVFFPALQFAEIGLGFGMSAVFAVLAALVMTLAAPLAVGEKARLSLAPLAAAAIGLSFAVGAALVAPAYSKAAPQPMSIQYYVDANERTGQWLLASTGEPAPREMRAVARFAPVDIAGLASGRQAATGPYLEVGPPEMLILADNREGNTRTLRIQLVSNGADHVMLRIPEEASARTISAGGRAYDFGGEGMPMLYCAGRSCNGAEFEIVLDAAEEAEWFIFGLSFGLPNAARSLVEARPASATPIQNGDATIVRKRKKV